LNLTGIVWKELRERPAAMLTAALAVLLGVAALVAIRHVTVSSEREVARQLESLGANVLVLPRDATLQDYYAADMQAGSLPEEHVAEIMLSGVVGVEKLSPKLCVPAELAGRTITLTGILPQSELQTLASYQTISLFDRKHEGCQKAHLGPTADDAAPDALVTRRSIEELGDSEAILGADLAQRHDLASGDSIDLLGESFTVLAVLPHTGTVDDSRVFAHLHTVQRLAGTGEVVSAIEVIGCCEDAAGGLVPELSRLLPGARVVTISQVVSTQVGVNRLMAKGSLFVFGVLVLVGGAGVASTIAANVRERRREIARMFLLKAVALGLVGGLTGAVLGMILAVWLGPGVAGTAVAPLPGFALMAVVAALTVALLAAWWPALRAARLDPCACLHEV
jgi:putative ABC transport system permease protein